MQVERGQDWCQVLLQCCKSLATRVSWICRLYWDDVTRPRGLQTENRSVSVYLLLFLWAINCFHHYREVNQKHAAEITAVCKEWWGLTAKLQNCNKQEVFLQRSLEPMVQAGHLIHDSKGQGTLLVAAFPWPKALVGKEWPPAAAKTGEGMLWSEPLTGQWHFCTLEWLGHYQVNARHHDCIPAWRRISGGVAHAAACLKALYLWVPEHRLYGVFLLVKKDTMFV